MKTDPVKIEKIPLDPDKKKYSYHIRAVVNGYVVVKHRQGFREDYIFDSVIDMLKWVINSLTGKCVDGYKHKFSG